MSHPLYVAFIWHQHQPLYKSRQVHPTYGGQYRLPWARLHGTKDYLDLVLLLEDYPRLHQTVNLVPSLILQLEEYANGEAIDPYLALTLKPENDLNREQKQYIIDHFFDANHHTMIDPHARYRELYEQKQEKGKNWCLEHWNSQDYSDLLAWHNLAWIDPLFWGDPEIEAWLEKGRGFTLSDRQRIYSKQKDIIFQIIPQHKKMQDAGQLEITTTPYTHPILPLLADSQAGRVARPDLTLPKTHFQWGEDIPRHLQKAWNLYVDKFEVQPRGLWPSEQSVSPAILPDVAKLGFNWIVSDEAVLGWTLQHFFHRDETGNIYEPEFLYRPYRLETPHGDLAIVFRDHRLSDLIGFTYGSMKPEKAAADLVGHLEAIARNLGQRQKTGSTSLEKPWLVTIALDGENCWEFYPQDGKPFLESLYRRLSQQNDLKLVTVSEFIEQFPPTATIKSDLLHSGSWVDGNFTTWIGDPAKNKAWEYLQAARETLAQHPEATEETNPEAWFALDAAQGSDWFWWFGEPHHSNHDEMFDQLFREHLSAVYQSLNEPIPDYLFQPIEIRHQRGDHVPEGFIHPLIDGIGDEQDWDKAGRIEIGGARGTMHRSSIIPRLFYGWDHLNFYFRFDLQPGENLPSELHLFWFYPGVKGHNCPIPLSGLPDRAPLNYHFRYHLGINLATQTFWLQEAGEDSQWHSRHCQAEIALVECLELAVPWGDLHIEPDLELSLGIILAENGQFRDYLPENALIRLQAP
jgi:alpha-amylase/alpha-mannosidase (GH57 family)